MTIWICSTCLIEHPDAAAPPETCKVCSDERQWVPASGQSWTTHDDLARAHALEFHEVEPGMQAITLEPNAGIGQRGLLARTEGGNLLWEPPGLITRAAVESVRRLGGLAAVTASHPHLVGSGISWAREFDVPFYFAQDDADWVLRPDDHVTFWAGTAQVLPGLALHQVGGHFDGSCVALWQPGSARPGILLAGDSVMVGKDRKSVSAMRSFPNFIPLGASDIRRIVEVLDPLDYDRIYSVMNVSEWGAKAIVASSFERYLSRICQR